MVHAVWWWPVVVNVTSMLAVIRNGQCYGSILLVVVAETVIVTAAIDGGLCYRVIASRC